MQFTSNNSILKLTELVDYDYSSQNSLVEDFNKQFKSLSMIDKDSKKQNLSNVQNNHHHQTLSTSPTVITKIANNRSEIPLTVENLENQRQQKSSFEGNEDPNQWQSTINMMSKSESVDWSGFVNRQKKPIIIAKSVNFHAGKIQRYLRLKQSESANKYYCNFNSNLHINHDYYNNLARYEYN